MPLDPSSLAAKWTAGWYTLLSIITFLAYAYDKRAAARGSHRVRERTLHLLEWLGGVPGALVAIYALHHKNRKARFLVVTVVALLAHLAAWAIAWRLFGSQARHGVIP